MLKNVKGFTLIEVLIAVGVLSVASLAFLPSFTGSYKEKNLQRAQEAVKDAITTARSKALTEVGNPSASESTVYNYSGIKFIAGSGDYYLFRSNAATSGACASPTIVDSTKSLPSGIVARIASSKTPTCIFFEYKTGATLITEGTTEAKTCND